MGLRSIGIFAREMPRAGYAIESVAKVSVVPRKPKVEMKGRERD